MKRFAVRFAVLSALGVAMLAFTSSDNSSANNLADPTTKEIMQKANGKGGLAKALSTGLKDKEPKWEDLAAKAKELTPLAKALGGNKPPKGDAEAWKKLTDEYAKAAVDLEDAIAKKDQKAAIAAMKPISACMDCHKAHKGK